MKKKKITSHEYRVKSLQAYKKLLIHKWVPIIAYLKQYKFQPIYLFIPKPPPPSHPSKKKIKNKIVVVHVVCE